VSVKVVYTGLVNGSGKIYGVGRFVDKDGRIIETLFQNERKHGYQRVITKNGYEIKQYNEGDSVSWKRCENGKNTYRYPDNENRVENDP
jgi:hypothetical protein